METEEGVDWSNCLIVSPEVYNLYMALMGGISYDSNPMCDPAVALRQQQGLDSNPMCDPAVALRQRALVRGSALVIEDLEPVMRNVTFSVDHIKLQKTLSEFTYRWEDGDWRKY